MNPLPAATAALSINLGLPVAIPSASKASSSSCTWRKSREFHPVAGVFVREETLTLTLHKTVNLCLSSRGLPLAAGYSQSRSRPSNAFVLSSLMEDWMNTFLLAGVDTIVVNLEREIMLLKEMFMSAKLRSRWEMFYLAVPNVHPPTANSVFRFALL